ncbi:hypothetical protein ACH4E7_20885 [Kitasatospora sp. NPDC018058]|uniref:hypothetical protein n=1 Tax=Kitasatospora sp. NPDC018058 TaxID=3364025 RepID=UPI0037C18389
MDAAEFDRRARGTYVDWIPSDLVARLIELGHLDRVQQGASFGDWHCARAWVEQLAGEGRQDDALAVLAPYIEAGSWNAARVHAELLERWGYAEEAIAFVQVLSEAGVGKGAAFEYPSTSPGCWRGTGRARRRTRCSGRTSRSRGSRRPWST